MSKRAGLRRKFLIIFNKVWRVLISICLGLARILSFGFCAHERGSRDQVSGIRIPGGVPIYKK